MKKVLYHVYSGTVTNRPLVFVYKFSSTPDIKLSVSKKGFSIDVYRTVKKDGSEILNDPLFRDALKKAAKIQLIKFGAITKGPVYAEIDGNSCCVFDSGTESARGLLYCMCGSVLHRKIADNWDKSALQRIVTVTKTKTNRLDSALDAYLVAKSKVYETEKFIYLWMTMNGLYGYAGEVASKHVQSGEEKDWISKEYAQLKFFSMLNGLAYRRIHNKKDEEAEYLKKATYLLNGVAAGQKTETVKSLKANDLSNQLVNDLCALFAEAGVEQGKLHPYAAVLIKIAYFVRCKYFHAERTIPLICFENEYPIPALRLLNAVLEDYFDENLYKWFDSDILNNEIVPRIIKLAENCRCKNSYLKSCIVDGKQLA